MFLSDRRQFVAALGASATLAALPAAARAVVSAGSASFAALLASFADELLQLSPATATSLGVDTGKNAGLRARLADGSAAGRARTSAEMDSIRARLAKVDRRTLSPAQALRYDTVDYAAARGQDGARFRYGGGAGDGFGGGATPYAITQQNGTINYLPEFLNSQHPVKTSSDAEAYLARVAAMGRALDEETDQMRGQAAIGVIPPDFIAANALGQLKDWRAVAAVDQPMLASLVRRAGTAGVGGDWGVRCAKLIESSVYPALDRQIAAFADVTRGASHVGSVQRLPQGDAYYAYALRLGTTTTIPAADIHKTGLEQNAEIKAKIDAILKSQGMTSGTVGERVVALNADPRFLFPNTDDGRAQLIAYIKGRIAAVRPLLPRMSRLGLKSEVDVKRVPPDIQDGAALGYMNFASLDGSRPATYYVNLKSTALWPKYQLATLTAHEGVPGHTWQGAYLAEHHAEVPLITSMMGFNAFVEGWALYAEQLMDELGLYKDDPFGRVGYLQAQQFRWCRLVVDTGIHSMGWSRDKAIDFIVGETGKGRDAMTSEIDRYCASPGQACGYKVGHNEILRLRAKAMKALGQRFDLRNYDDMVVKTGGVPLTILASEVDRFIARGGTA
ncbi:MAG: DUF885 family protein [Sphingomonadaceae bacterium]|nr:DUF885 family protein [Sphingomonadaceae bacterium]